ncbi:hypothetical protein Pelo_17352 [Pelomyxa schiedti]|nr:hypothetical protein Pelo_17352 [Pelomyxa schiedti]
MPTGNANPDDKSKVFRYNWRDDPSVLFHSYNQYRIQWFMMFNIDCIIFQIQLSRSMFYCVVIFLDQAQTAASASNWRAGLDKLAQAHSSASASIPRMHALVNSPATFQRLIDIVLQGIESAVLTLDLSSICTSTKLI